MAGAEASLLLGPWNCPCHQEEKGCWDELCWPFLTIDATIQLLAWFLGKALHYMQISRNSLGVYGLWILPGIFYGSSTDRHTSSPEIYDSAITNIISSTSYTADSFKGATCDVSDPLQTLSPLLLTLLKQFQLLWISRVDSVTIPSGRAFTAVSLFRQIRSNSPKKGNRAVHAVCVCFTAESSFLITLLPHKTFSCVLGLAQKSCSAVSMHSMQWKVPVSLIKRITAMPGSCQAREGVKSTLLTPSPHSSLKHFANRKWVNFPHWILLSLLSWGRHSPDFLFFSPNIQIINTLSRRQKISLQEQLINLQPW